MRIGELAVETGTNVETVRYYERIGLLPETARTMANYRTYGQVHLDRLRFIRRARDIGFALDAVRELLGLVDNRDQSCEAVDAIARARLFEIERKIDDLLALQCELQRMVGHCQQGSVADCKIIEALSGKPRA